MLSYSSLGRVVGIAAGDPIAVLDANLARLCRAVRYRLVGEPLMVAVCHCTTRQKNTGSAFSTNLAMPPGAVEIFGEDLSIYQERADALPLIETDPADANETFPPVLM